MWKTWLHCEILYGLFKKLTHEACGAGRHASPFTQIKAYNVSILSNELKAQPLKYTSSTEWDSWLRKVHNFCTSRSVPRSLTCSSESLPKITPVFVEKPCDNRPYLEVLIFDFPVVALLDSGANSSVLGSEGIHLLHTFNVNISPTSQAEVTVADGTKQKIIGKVELTIKLNGQCRSLPILVVPTLCHSLILGSDFCKEFGLVVNFSNNSWCISNQSVQKISTQTISSPTGSSKSWRHGLESLSNLSSDEKLQVERVLEQYKELSPEGCLGRTNKITHHIDTGDAKPFRQRQYQMSPFMLKHLNRLLDNMLSLGVVEPSTSSWCSPVLLVKKKSTGEYRFCFDGRKLNSVTKFDSYQLPRVDHILNMLRDTKYLSSIDLKHAFWQIPLTPESKEKTAFSVPGRGLFQFTVLPFGLSNSAQCQQRLMDYILGPELEPKVFVYLDDVIITASSFEEHLELLQVVHDRLHSAGLTINIEKCQFFRASLNYLGFMIDAQGLRTSPEKIEAIVNYSRPRNTTEIKRFMGMCSWYRRFVPLFSSLMAPLSDLIKRKGKKQAIEWNDAAEEAFHNMKNALISAPILTSPDFSRPFVIQTDASETGLGGVLTQIQDGDEKVIAFASRSLSRAERNYSVTERECLAVIFAIDKFRPYIEGTRFKVITDHYSLLWLNRMKEPSGKLARWAVKLAQHNFELLHRKGKLNVVPDALSRAHIVPPPLVLNVDLLGVDLKDLDPWYVELRQKVQSDPDNFPSYAIKDNYLYHYRPLDLRVPQTNISPWKLVVPSSCRKKILEASHNVPTSGHLGFYKTVHKVSESYYWPKMRRDVYLHIKKCPVCPSQKMPNYLRLGLMGAQRKIKFPWQCVSIDIMGPYTRSRKGNSYLIVATDYFSKFVLIRPARQVTAKTVVDFLENEIFLMFGVPQYLICDNGTQFTSKLFKDLAAQYKIQNIWYNARYHPQANPVERVNRTIGTAIRCFIKDSQKDWDLQIPRIGHALRTAIHEVTGYSPNFLNFGRKVPVSGEYYGHKENPNANFDLDVDDVKTFAAELNKLPDLYRKVQDKLTANYKKNARIYNLRRRHHQFKVGEKVWKRNFVLSNAAKDFTAHLAPRYLLCTVHKVRSPLVYDLKYENGTDAGAWHVSQLKPYFQSGSDISNM